MTTTNKHLQNKLKVFHMFKLLLVLIDTQFSTYVKILQSNLGREYMSYEFQSFLQFEDIIFQRSCPNHAH